MDLPFTQELGRAVKRLQHRHHRALDIALSEVGISLAQWDALRAVEWNPDASSHALAELTFMTDQSFGALALRLEERGLITRTPGKGRTLCHRLTRSGRKIVGMGTAVVERVLSVSFGPLSQAQREQLFSLLSQLLIADEQN
jgi:DNA-binding MarR family transcriptional regulator